MNSAFLNEGTGNESPQDLENIRAPRSGTGDHERQFRQRTTPEVCKGGSLGVSAAVLTRGGGRKQAGGSARAPGASAPDAVTRRQAGHSRPRDAEGRRGTPRAAPVWGARARARAAGVRAAAPTAPPGRGQRRPDTRVLGSLRTCPPARPAPGHALSQSQAPGGKRHGHLWRLLSRRNATSKDFSHPYLRIRLPFPPICAVADRRDLGIALKVTRQKVQGLKKKKKIPPVGKAQERIRETVWIWCRCSQSNYRVDPQGLNQNKVKYI